jgi:mannose-1-phosphate guanylyltransferase / phosphomannomutase
MKAVILAGGRGTRLKSGDDGIPKSMVRIGPKPVLEHQIDLLRRYGFKDIILIVGYKSEVIAGYFRDGEKWGVKIEYFIEDKPLGTTGGLKEIESKLTSDFILLYGDVMMDISLSRLLDFHKSKKGIATLVIHPNDHPYDSDLVEINSERRIVKFHPKPHPPDKFYKNLVNAAVYVFSPRMLGCIKKGVKEDLGRDIFPSIAASENLYGYITAEYIKDIGTIDRLKAVNSDYSSGRIAALNMERPRRCVFLDRDGVINKKVDQLHRVEDFELLENAASGLRKLNESGYLTIVVTNQPAVARGLCTVEQVEEIHKKMDTLLGQERAKLDETYYCPHHPDKGYPEENQEYKIVCDCRKPKTGMILQAQKEYNINLNGSFLIGDSHVDILCGKNAGLKTIGVRTGDGCKDCGSEADYYFDDLDKAADFICACQNFCVA